MFLILRFLTFLELFSAENYGGPYLQTQQTLLQTQHSIIEAQQGYCRNTI